MDPALSDLVRVDADVEEAHDRDTLIWQSQPIQPPHPLRSEHSPECAKPPAAGQDQTCLEDVVVEALASLRLPREAKSAIDPPPAP